MPGNEEAPGRENSGSAIVPGKGRNSREGLRNSQEMCQGRGKVPGERTKLGKVPGKREKCRAVEKTQSREVPGKDEKCQGVENK